MADTLQFLCLNPAIGYDTHHCRHEKTNDTLNRVEPSDLVLHAVLEQIRAHRD